MRLATWNIRLGIQEGLEPIAETLETFDADVVALQEVGRRWVMGPSGDSTRELADLAGYPHYYFVPSLSWYPPAQYGHAVLSRYPILAPSIERLPREGDEQRTMLEFRVQRGESLTTVLTTHLSHVGDRPRQGARLLDRVAAGTADGEQIVLMGDLNESDRSADWFAGLTELGSFAPAMGPTFPADDPRHRIDWVFANFGDWSEATVVDTGTRSDHLAVIAELS